MTSSFKNLRPRFPAVTATSCPSSLPLSVMTDCFCVSTLSVTAVNASVSVIPETSTPLMLIPDRIVLSGYLRASAPDVSAALTVRARVPATPVNAMPPAPMSAIPAAISTAANAVAIRVASRKDFPPLPVIPALLTISGLLTILLFSRFLLSDINSLYCGACQKC